MLHSLLIKNYQSHKNSLFEFHPGVNVLVGTSDSGKSSVFRGLKLLLLNRPLGLTFRSNFAKLNEPTEITAVVQNRKNRIIVTRLRSESENRYRAQGISYSAFGSEVPDKIVEIMNMTDINYQFQMDSPFLFGESPGAVARYLNKVVNLDKIDVALQNITSKKRQNETELKNQQARLNEIVTTIKEFPDLNSIDKTIVSLEKLSEHHQDLVYSVYNLANCIKNIEDINNKIQNVHKISKLKPIVHRLEKLSNEKYKTELRYDSLFKLLRSISQIELKLVRTKKLTKCYNVVRELEIKDSEVEMLHYTKDSLTSVLSNIENYDSIVQIKQQFIKKESSRLRELIGEICPLCGQLIGEDVAKKSRYQKGSYGRGTKTKR